jgi:hypothetical protein
MRDEFLRKKKLPNKIFFYTTHEGLYPIYKEERGVEIKNNFVKGFFF